MFHSRFLHRVAILFMILICSWLIIYGEVIWGSSGMGTAKISHPGIIIAMCVVVIALIIEWKGIFNRMRVKNMPLASVERDHPYVPKYGEIVTTVLLTIVLIVMFTQVATKAYSAPESPTDEPPPASSSAPAPSSSSESPPPAPSPGGTSGTTGVMSSSRSSSSSSSSQLYTAAQAPHGTGKIEVVLYRDYSFDGVKDITTDQGFKNISVTITGELADATPLSMTKKTDADGLASFSVPVLVQDRQYIVSFNGMHHSFSQWRPSGTITDAVNAIKDDTKKVAFPFIPTFLRRPLAPCISINNTVQLRTPGNITEELFRRLERADGAMIPMPNQSATLVSRSAFLRTLLALTDCRKKLTDEQLVARLEENMDGTDVRDPARLFVDLPLKLMNGNVNPVAVPFYQALTLSIPVSRTSTSGQKADPMSPVTLREAVRWISAIIDSDANDVADTNTDADMFTLLQSAGVLQPGLRADRADRGMLAAEAQSILLKTMYSAGTVDILDASTRAPAITSNPVNLLNTLGSTLEGSGCLTAYDDRQVTAAIRPSHPDFERYHFLQRLGFPDAETPDKIYWVLGGIQSEYGPKSGMISYPLANAMPNIEMLRSLAIAFCRPVATRSDEIDRLNNRTPNVSGTLAQVKGSPNILYGLPDSDVSYASRIARAVLTPDTANIGLLDKASDIFTRTTFTPLQPLTIDQASRMLGSAFAGYLLRNNAITYAEWDNAATELRYAVFEKVTGKVPSEWGNSLPAVSSQLFTYRHFLLVMSQMLEPVHDDASYIHTPLEWRSLLK